MEKTFIAIIFVLAGVALIGGCVLAAFRSGGEPTGTSAMGVLVGAALCLLGAHCAGVRIRWLLLLPSAMDHAAQALILLNRGERRDAEHAWWTARMIFAHGRYPTNDEYKAYSARWRDKD